MPDRADLTDALIVLIPDDGSRIANAEIKAALEQELGDPHSDEDLKEIKNHVVAMGAAQGAKGKGGGLKAPGIPSSKETAAAAPGSINDGNTPRSAKADQAPRLGEDCWSRGLPSACFWQVAGWRAVHASASLVDAHRITPPLAQGNWRLHELPWLRSGSSVEGLGLLPDWSGARARPARHA